ncbi:Folliculin [Pleurostoma richardsiae]|uniref:Folliculin n=1 Tax=Pleurostoma richardsiae TaxID=41990 RepID=A0AA38RH23_9PEZI|nr:Folliculin [Pleurostoma richardsiae]
MILTAGIQLCLAHYCDVHGPTPLMVTEGLPVPCSVCYDQDLPSYAGNDRPHSSQTSASANSATAIADALRRLDLGGVTRSSSVPASERDMQAQRAALLRTTQVRTATGSAVETPPASPRYPPDAQQVPPQVSRRDSQYKKTYDEHTTKRAGPCENCALTLPRRQEAASCKGAGGLDAGPTLRTRAPYARVYGHAGDASPPTSTSTSTDTEEEDVPSRRRTHRRTGTITSSISRSSSSSASRLNSHTHYLDYTSTHEPVVPSSYSIVRASCLRTLSFETLPRHAAATTGAGGSSAALPAGPFTSGVPPSALSSPAGCSSTSSSPFITTHSPGTAAAGGPIFFGDPTAGYTTAYIFRIPDVHARGHKRVYAFLALSTHRERQAMRAFGFIAAAFRDLAAWIQALAEAAAERAYDDSGGGGSAASSPVASSVGYNNTAAAAAGGLGIISQSQPVGDGAGAAAAGSTASGVGGSSFLTGGVGGMSRRMGSGFGGSGVSLRARGLPELVGLPDFFIELHAKFVRLLLELGVMLNS